MDAKNYKGYNRESIMATSLVEVVKELYGTETVYSIKVDVLDKEIHLRPETAIEVVNALNQLFKKKSLDYKKKKHECLKVPIHIPIVK